MMQRLKSLRTWMGALTAIALLAAWPAMVGAEETIIPPQMDWTATPPASHTIDSKQHAEMLLKKGVISPQELAMLQGGEAAQANASTQPCAVSQRVSR